MLLLTKFICVTLANKSITRGKFVYSTYKRLCTYVRLESEQGVELMSSVQIKINSV